MEDLNIPDFLRIDAETRKANWAGIPLTSWSPSEDVRQRALREAREAAKKVKAAAALARMKQEHAGERWHPKQGWIRDEKSLAALEAQQLAEFNSHCKHPTDVGDETSTT